MLVVRDMLELASTLEGDGTGSRSCSCCRASNRCSWTGRDRGRRSEGADARQVDEPLAAVDIDGLRPYRPGTPASRIHWAALARGAGLLERRLRADGDTRPLVVLDARSPGPPGASRRGRPRGRVADARAGTARRLPVAAPGRAPPGRRRARPRQLAGSAHAAGAGRGRSRDARRRCSDRARGSVRSSTSRRSRWSVCRPRWPESALPRSCSSCRRRSCSADVGRASRSRVAAATRSRARAARSQRRSRRMSTGAQVAVLDARGVRQTPARARSCTPVERPRVRLVAFGGTGALRRASLGDAAQPGAGVAPARAGRGRGADRRARHRVARPTAGRSRSSPRSSRSSRSSRSPGSRSAWVRHVRIAVTADAIDQGLSALPHVLVPYNGINEWVRTVIMLGAGVLLLDAALMVAFAPRPLGELRRAVAALPLVVLAVVPSTLARPPLAYLHGLILFGLLAAFVWGERIPRYDAPLAVGFAITRGRCGDDRRAGARSAQPVAQLPGARGHARAGARGVVRLVAALRAAQLAAQGREVLDVQAERPDYWKARGPRPVQRHRLDRRATIPSRAAAAGARPPDVARWTPDDHGDAARDADVERDRRGCRRAARSISATARGRGSALGPG